MSMDDALEEAEAARAALGKLAAKVRALSAAAEKDLKGLDTDSRNVEVGSRAAQRAIQDERDVLLEELGQYREVLDRVVTPSAPTPVPPAPPEEPPAPPQTATPPPPEREPTPEPPAPEPERTVVVVPWWRFWRRPTVLWTIILAVLFGLIAFFVASGNVDEVGRNAVGDGGFAQSNWYKEIIVLVAVVFGTIIGALLGSLLDRELDED